MPRKETETIDAEVTTIEEMEEIQRKEKDRTDTQIAKMEKIPMQDEIIDDSLQIIQPPYLAPTGDGLRLYDLLVKFVQEKLVEGVHYGKALPNSKQTSLLKGGAQILAKEFGIDVIVEEVTEECVADYDTLFFAAVYKAHATRRDTGEIIPDSWVKGACNSKESSISSGDKGFAHHRVLSQGAKRAYTACVITTLALSSVFTYGLEDLRSAKEGRKDKRRREAFAIAQNDLKWTGAQIKEYCLLNFPRVDEETGEVGYDEDGKLIHVTSRSEMTLNQWEELVDYLKEKRLEARKAKAKAAQEAKVKAKAAKEDAKAEEGSGEEEGKDASPKSDPPETGSPGASGSGAPGNALEDLVVEAAQKLGIAAIDLRVYLERVYLTCFSTIDTDTTKVITTFLRKVGKDSKLLDNVRADYDKQSDWFDEHRDDDHTGQELQEALMGVQRTVVERFFSHMGAKTTRITQIDKRKFASWPEVLKAAKAEDEASRSKKD